MKPFCVILVLGACVGCPSNTSEQQKEPAKGVQSPVKGSKLVTRAQSQELSKDLAAAVEGNNEFAFDLYRQLAQKPGNKFFSPYSIATALAMTYAGARGNTAMEMAHALHFTLDNAHLHPAFGELMHKVQGDGTKRNYKLGVANSLWGAKGLSVHPNFLRITQDDYQAVFRFVDFANDAEGARQRINGWVEDKTNKKIVDLLPQGLIKPTTRLVLANAIYFKGDWLLPFPKEDTKPNWFTIPGSPAFKVPMMNRTFETNYLETAEFQLAEFTYMDYEVSMVVILPKKQDGLAGVEKEFSAKALAQALSAARPRQLQVALPKFKMAEAIDLGEHLVALGMKDAFGAADFSGISSSESLRISAVVHKAFVRVDEMGTEAAAASAVEMSSSDAQSPTSFRADHPFLFVLRHRSTTGILFLARVVDPRGN